MRARYSASVTWRACLAGNDDGDGHRQTTNCEGGAERQSHHSRAKPTACAVGGRRPPTRSPPRSGSVNGRGRSHPYVHRNLAPLRVSEPGQGPKPPAPPADRDARHRIRAVRRAASRRRQSGILTRPSASANATTASPTPATNVNTTYLNSYVRRCPDRATRRRVMSSVDCTTRRAVHLIADASWLTSSGVHVPFGRFYALARSAASITNPTVCAA